MFLLDTDHVVISQQQSMPEYDHLIQRVRQHDASLFFVSIISFHEQVMGWNVHFAGQRPVRCCERVRAIAAGVVQLYRSSGARV